MAIVETVPRDPLAPAAAAFDAIADRFDERFGAWLSVAAQRRAVRAELCRLFAPGARVLELGGGTGEDAVHLTRLGRTVLHTDASPAMVAIAAGKLRPLGAPEPIVMAAEDLPSLPERVAGAVPLPLDGAFSNFAALNCVSDLSPVAAGLAGAVRPGGRLALVVFGTCPPGEWVVQLVRGDARAAFRRRARGDVVARLGGRMLAVRYHRVRDIERALSPWFRPTARRGIGVFVPPSAAEPWISRHASLLTMLERLDRLAGRPLAAFGDHVLLGFVRTAAPAPARAGES